MSSTEEAREAYRMFKADMRMRSKRWNEGCEAAAQFITAVEDQLPCCLFTSELEDILRPYLGTKPHLTAMRARRS